MEQNDFKEQVSDLLAGTGILPASRLALLSDLDISQLAEFEAAWRDAPVERRARVLVGLRDLAEESIEYNFKRVFLVALRDSDPDVRAAAVEGLWEEDGTFVLDRLQNVVLYDRSSDVRASSASALGRFCYRGAVGELDATKTQELQETLRRVLRDAADGSELQMRAMEALAYFQDDPVANDLIGRLYREGDDDEQASALLAMGRSMNPRWSDAVLQELDSSSAPVRFQAARAAGEMALDEAVPTLSRLVDDPDVEVRHASVWALGQIGTQPATEVLRALASSESRDLSEAAQEALSEAAYAPNAD